VFSVVDHQSACRFLSPAETEQSQVAIESNRHDSKSWPPSSAGAVFSVAAPTVGGSHRRITIVIVITVVITIVVTPTT
jgi:hypothetical protein